MIRCDEAMDLICLLVDEELTENEEERLKDHLECCPDCRTFEKTMRRMSMILSDPEPLPPELHRKIMQSVSTESEKDNLVSFSEEKQKRNWKWKKITLAAACLFFAVLIGFQAPSFLARKGSSNLYERNAVSAAGSAALAEAPVEREEAESALEAGSTFSAANAAGESKASDAKLFMSSDTAALPEAAAILEEALDTKQYSLQELLSFLNGEPIHSLAAAEMTAPDLKISALDGEEEYEFLLWVDGSGLDYTWGTDGWLYRSEQSMEAFLANFPD